MSVFLFHLRQWLYFISPQTTTVFIPFQVTSRFNSPRITSFSSFHIQRLVLHLALKSAVLYFSPDNSYLHIPSRNGIFFSTQKTFTFLPFRKEKFFIPLEVMAVLFLPRQQLFLISSSTKFVFYSWRDKIVLISPQTRVVIYLSPDSAVFSLIPMQLPLFYFSPYNGCF